MSVSRHGDRIDSSSRLRRGKAPAVLVFSLLMVLILAACGDDGDGAAEEEPATDDTEEEPATEDGAEEEPAEGETEEEPAEEGASGEESGGEETAFPEDDLRMIIPSSEGGGLDTIARQAQPYWEDELGVNIAIENVPGAGFAVGTNQYVNQEEPDCYTILYSMFPNHHFSFLTQEGAEYTYEELYPILETAYEPTVVLVQQDAPWESLQELIDEAVENPGDITGSVSSFTNNQYKTALDLQDATGAEFNLVPYDGGGPARNALVAGEVDFSIGGVFNYQNIREETRVLAVSEPENEWADLTDDAPTINEELGTDIPSNPHTRIPFVHRECMEEYPERYEVLVETAEAAHTADGFMELLEEEGTEDKIRIRSAEEVHEWLQEQEPDLEQIVSENEEMQP